MSKERPPTILCVSSYEKGQEFMRTCKREGWDVFLLTMEKLRDADWPREAITEAFYLPEELPLQGLINAVSYMARSRPIDRIVALDEFDMENVAALREHLRIPGMGLTTMRYFRDKLAMRGRAKEESIAIPEFVHVLNYDDLREFMARVKAPWLLKPRSQASGIGMKIIKPRERALAVARPVGRSAIILSARAIRTGRRVSRGQHRLGEEKWYSQRRTRTEARRSMCLTEAECSPAARCRALPRCRNRC